jgi:hypothetical protein
MNAAVVLFIASLTVPFAAAGPYRGALPSVTKPVATLVILRTAALRHGFGPGSSRTIIHDGLIERGELEPRTSLKNFRERARAVHRGCGGRRRLRRRCRRRRRGCRRRRRFHSAWLQRVLDPPSPRHLIVRRARGRAPKADPCNKSSKEGFPMPQVHGCPQSHSHAGLKPPGPLRIRMPFVNGARP